MVIKRILVANRGEIACRIFRTCDLLGIETVAVYSDADENSKHVRMADLTARIGEAPASSSYLDIEAILRAASDSGVDAIHPGYGFLSENSEFARRIQELGLIWVGPDPESMDSMSEKVPARALMLEAGVPVVPGTSGSVDTLDHALLSAQEIGYPMVLKATAGGGGLGMSVVTSVAELEKSFDATRRKAERAFGNGSVYLEKYIESAKHIEVQVLGLNSGNVAVVGDRECSVQRRHQKVVEEAPAPTLSGSERDWLHVMAQKVAEKVKYRGAGTVEFIFDRMTREFYFLEMNTRLQVEHPVTELVTGLDLVELQIRIAAGQELDLARLDRPTPQGHAIEFRVYAEDPVRFLPGPGEITTWAEPGGPGVRVDSGYDVGDIVTPYYDPLLAKLCVHDVDRDHVLRALGEAAQEFDISGPKTNLSLVEGIVGDPSFAGGEYDTEMLKRVVKQKSA